MPLAAGAARATINGISGGMDSLIASRCGALLATGASRLDSAVRLAYRYLDV
jgi:hypothetical protein